jgi:uncharacterized protein (TIGR03000 family)
MYSVLLVAAISTGTADAPAFHKRSLGCTGAMYLHSGYYASCIGCLGWDAWAAGHGCMGACHGCQGGACFGCYGCMGCYGVYTAPAQPAGNPMMAPAATPPTDKPAAPPAGSGTPDAGSTPKAAKLIIEKPADARLFVDDLPVRSDAATQVFATPALDPSQAYYYTVRVETIRDGKPQSETRRVIVRAGETVHETFREPGIATASLKNDSVR